VIPVRTGTRRRLRHPPRSRHVEPLGVSGTDENGVYRACATLDLTEEEEHIQSVEVPQAQHRVDLGQRRIRIVQFVLVHRTAARIGSVDGRLDRAHQLIRHQRRHSERR
jgi:hypothetical protein